MAQAPATLVDAAWLVVSVRKSCLTDKAMLKLWCNPSSANPKTQSHQHSPLHRWVHTGLEDAIVVLHCPDLVGYSHHLDRVVQNQAVCGPSLRREPRDMAVPGDQGLKKATIC
jgi:hypothetical protein